MSIGALDTDSAALKTRLDLQARLSSFDLNDWIFGHFPYERGQRWLDLGCGTGKQSIPLARAGCVVTAVDKSAESLALVEADGIRTICCDLDDFAPARAFDRAIASYSLYYARDPERLIKEVANSTNGLFFCGPAHDNNLELRELVASVTGKPVEPTRPAAFMEETGPRIAERYFARVEIFRFKNEVVFRDPDELFAYWTSHNLHDPAFDGAFRQAVPAMPFINVKRGVGVRALHR